MKKLSRILAVVLSLIMIISAIPFTASAGTVTGTCGENLTWTFDDSTGTLTISGTGAMHDYDYYNRPWETYEDSIKKAIIEDGVTTIGDYAFFYYSKLTSVTIPDSVTSIGEWAFYYCTRLKSVNITDLSAWCNITFNGSSNPLYYGADLYLNGTKVTDLVIPDDVTKLNSYVFYNCTSLESVTIPDSVTTIGDYAFAHCYSLTSVTIPDSVTSIGEEAFYYCTSLESVTIPDSVVSLGSEVFLNCSNLKSIFVDSNNQYYSSDENGVLFNKDKSTLIQFPSGNESYTIPDSVTSIDMYAFCNCESLTSITIPDSVTTIGDYAFASCDSLTNITVDSNNQYYSSNESGVLFDKDKTTLLQYPIGNTRTSYTIPDSVTSIGDWAFYRCDSLTSVTIGDNVTTIGNYAFERCTSLTSITIPDSVTTIGYYAFGSCDNRTDVYYTGTEEEWKKISIGLGNNPLLNATIHFNYNPHVHEFGEWSVVTEPTCTETGLKTRNCECGDVVTEEIPATGHKFESVVTPPTCTERGYTTYTCHCGYSYNSDYVDALGHNYNSVVTAPTCTEKGFTTYICHCGYSYNSDYVNALGHNYNSVVTAPTCTERGYTTNTCSICGDSYVDNYVEASGHTYDSVVTPATCTESGYTTCTCECGDTYIANITPELGHNDSDGDGYCETCDKLICSHNCHKSGFEGFFWKIANFFNKLFGSNKYCDCGATHY